MAAQIAARVAWRRPKKNSDSGLNDPQKLLELIAAHRVRKAVEFLGRAQGDLCPPEEAPGAGRFRCGRARGWWARLWRRGSRRWDKHWDWARNRILDCRWQRCGVPFLGQRPGGWSWLFWVIGGGLGAGLGGGLGAGLGAGKRSGTGGHGEPSEDEIFAILSALTSFGHVGTGQGGMAAAGVFQEQMSQLPGRAQDMFEASAREPGGASAETPSRTSR